MGGLKNLCPFQELLLPPAASFPKAEFGVLHCISLFGRPAETGRTGDPGLPSEDVIEPKLQMGATCSLGGAAREREGRVGGSVEKSPPIPLLGSIGQVALAALWKSKRGKSGWEPVNIEPTHLSNRFSSNEFTSRFLQNSGSQSGSLN